MAERHRFLRSDPADNCSTTLAKKGGIGATGGLTGLSAHDCWGEVEIATIGAELIARLAKRIPVLVIDAMNGIRTKPIVTEGIDLCWRRKHADKFVMAD